MSTWRLVCTGLLLWGQAVLADPAWVLHGTIVQGEQHGYAILRDRHSHEQRLFQHGSQLNNGLLLEAIYPTHVRVRHPNGKAHHIQFGQPLNKATNSRTVPRRQVLSLIDSMSQPNPPLQLLPHQQDGKLNGFYINKVEDLPLASKLGLQRGDVIHAINDMPLGESANPGTILHTLLNGTELVVRIKRAGQGMTLRYQVR